MNTENTSKHPETNNAIVIGIGISGGWAAKELCENGLKTLVLDRGRYVKHIIDYPTMYMDSWDVDKELFKDGVKILANKFEIKFNKPISEGNKEDNEVLFSEYFALSKEPSDIILQQQSVAIKNIPAESLESYTLYKFLLSVRYYTLFGYYTSEKTGKEVLVYDPVPGVYNGRVPLNDVTKGKVWSL